MGYHSRNLKKDALSSTVNPITINKNESFPGHECRWIDEQVEKKCKKKMFEQISLFKWKINLQNKKN